MYHQIIVTLLKILPDSSASMKRGLHCKLKIANGPTKSSNCVLQTHFTKKWDGRDLRATRTIVEPITGSVSWHRSLSVYSSNSSLFRLNNKTGLDDGTSLQRPNANALDAPCRTLKAIRDPEGEGVRSPSFFAKMGNKLFGATPAVARRPPPLEELHGLLEGLPPSQTKAIMDLFERHIVANSSHMSGPSRASKWIVWIFLLPFLIYRSTIVVNENEGDDAGLLCETSTVTFKDVKGVDEAVSKLQEAVEFLRDSNKFTKVGGKLQNGILLVGPPGTGKTLLARAVAGEAGVPLFHAAGSEFNGIAGRDGAQRIHDLFEAAKEKAPCVIFIDKIDSIWAHRTGRGLGPGMNEVLNQLLYEIDGLHQNERVIVLAGTNRMEAVDNASFRPGRFHLTVQLFPPELNGREAILEHYLGKVKRGPDVDVSSLARRTVGFTGAHLEILVKQAALRATIERAEFVTMEHLEFALDKIVVGSERKPMIQSKQANCNYCGARSQ